MIKKQSHTIFAIILTIFLLTGCSGTNDNNLLGDWEFYGVVISDATDYSEDDYSMSDALVGKDFLDTYDLDEMPEANITLTEKGLKEVYEKIPGCEIISVEMVSKNQMHQRVKVTVIDGKRVNEPIYIDTYFTLVDGYLFEKNEYSDSSYDDGDINIYKRT